MKLYISGILFITLIFPGSVFAQSDIEKLIGQANIKEGKVALKNMTDWRKPKKIIMLNIGFSKTDIQAIMPGVEVIFVKNATEAIANIKGADAIIGLCDKKLTEAAHQAVWVQSISAGVERCVSADRIADGSTVLTNMQKMSSPVIAEHAIAMTLSLARRIPQFVKEMPGGEWLRSSRTTRDMHSIAGKTMLVIGLGGIGTEVARKASALGMRVTATRRSSHKGPGFVDYIGLSDELFKLAAEADYIVNALPLTEETTGLLDKKFFNVVKQGTFIINVGRGRTVVTSDLVSALKSGQVAGAGLDVTEPEPLPADHPLWQMNNVIITPHVAGSGGNWIRHTILIKENMRRLMTGDVLLNVVDPKLGY